MFQSAACSAAQADSTPTRYSEAGGCWCEGGEVSVSVMWVGWCRGAWGRILGGLQCYITCKYTYSKPYTMHPCPSSPASFLQLREDVTRFRYGDEKHLDEALTRIFQ